MINGTITCKKCNTLFGFGTVSDVVYCPICDEEYKSEEYKDDNLEESPNQEYDI